MFSPVVWDTIGRLLYLMMVVVYWAKFQWFVLWYSGRIVAFELGLLRLLQQVACLARKYPQKSIIKWKTCSCRPRNCCGVLSYLMHQLGAFSTVLDTNAMMTDRSTVYFNSDALSVICDNSANVHVCNDKNMFIGEMEPLEDHAVATIWGLSNSLSSIGTVKWTGRMIQEQHIHTWYWTFFTSPTLPWIFSVWPNLQIT